MFDSVPWRAPIPLQLRGMGWFYLTLPNQHQILHAETMTPDQKPVCVKTWLIVVRSRPNLRPSVRMPSKFTSQSWPTRYSSAYRLQCSTRLVSLYLPDSRFRVVITDLLTCLKSRYYQPTQSHSWENRADLYSLRSNHFRNPRVISI